MTQHTPQEIRRGFLYAIGVVIIWSGFVIISRFSGRGTLTPYDVIALRYGVAGIAILPLWFQYRTPIFSWRKLVLTSFGALGFCVFAFNGFRHAAASHAGILFQGALPFFVAVIVYLITGERPNRQRIYGLALIAAGVGMMALEAFQGGSLNFSGDGMLVLGCICWAMYSVLLRRWNMAPMETTIAVTLLATLIYMPVYLLFLPKHFSETPLDILVMIGAYQGVCVAVLQMICFTRANAILGASRMAVMTSPVPAVASLGAWAILGEPLSIHMAIGLGLVICGALFSNLNIGILPAYFRHKLGGHGA